MIANQKKNILCLIICLLSMQVSAQNKGDIGLILSNDRATRMALEYRLPVGEKYKFRVALSQGSFSYPNAFNPLILISASDSLVVEQQYEYQKRNWGARLGIERRLKASVFSIGADLGFDYQVTDKSKYLVPTILNEGGVWVRGGYNEPSPVVGIVYKNTIDGSSEYKRTLERFFVPNARLSVSADIPVGKAFVFNFALITKFGLPFYGGSKEYNSKNSFSGGSSIYSYIETRTYASAGVRYVVGSFKNRVRKT